MKLLKLLLGLFEQDPHIKETKKILKPIGKKIATTKDYDELVRLCREYKIIEEELKEYKKLKKKSLSNH
jgi:pyruvate-formate lyase